MRVKVLGSAAGGGFPQWNCGCFNCRRSRSGTIRAPRRSQAQLAVTADEEHWFLLGASPDLRYQLEGFPGLHPRREGRNSPISGVVLLSADLDHVLGLLLLREWQRLNVYSTATVRGVLLENTVFRLLERMPGQVCWSDIGVGSQFELVSPDGVRSGIRAWIIQLPGDLPAYASQNVEFKPEESVSALVLESPSGERMAYVPGLPAVTGELLDQLKESSVVLVDGTFWTEDELVRIEGFGRPASAIGHLPVSGPEGSLAQLAELQDARRIYMHINNTNPMLDEDGPEYREVRDRGWELAFDGMELTL